MRALLELASDSTQPQTCEGIAEAQQIPFRFLKSVFRDLRRADLVRSRRGCEGGYWLARDASAITVAEVMRAVDGAFLTLRGESLDDLAYPGAARRLPDTWRAVEAAADGVLATLTLAQLAGRAPAHRDAAHDSRPHDARSGGRTARDTPAPVAP